MVNPVSNPDHPELAMVNLTRCKNMTSSKIKFCANRPDCNTVIPLLSVLKQHNCLILTTRLENRLREIGYEYALPYWNSGLEEDIPNPADSAIFSETELGVSITSHK